MFPTLKYTILNVFFFVSEAVKINLYLYTYSMMEKLVHRVMLSCVNMEAIFGIYIKHTIVKNRLDDFVLKVRNIYGAFNFF